MPELPTIARPRSIKGKTAREFANPATIRLDPADRRAHCWYRFVLSFPPHLVRDYHRVTKLYFGGMARHLHGLLPVLRPGAMLAMSSATRLPIFA